MSNSLISDAMLRAARNVAVGVCPNKRDENLIDELESVCLEALTVAARDFVGDGQFAPFAVERMRWAAIRHVERFVGRPGGVSRGAGAPVVSLDAPISGEDERPMLCAVVQRSEPDPALAAEARESLPPASNGKARRSRLSEVSVVAPVPEAGAWAATLRAACYDAVSAQDMSDIMKTVVARAKKGDLGAVKLLLDYLAGGKRGLGVQQTVIIQHGAAVEEEEPDSR